MKIVGWFLHKFLSKSHQTIRRHIAVERIIDKVRTMYPHDSIYLSNKGEVVIIESNFGEVKYAIQLDSLGYYSIVYLNTFLNITETQLGELCDLIFDKTLMYYAIEDENLAINDKIESILKRGSSLSLTGTLT
jgi:hypothetical protein